MKQALWLLMLATGAGCTRAPEAAVDPVIAKALAETKAIDNHAHPVRPTAAGEPADLGYDALPVESLEAASDPVRVRPGAQSMTRRARRYSAEIGRRR